ncbi:MAG: hypothetical protein NZ899_13760 [Thermoguttaceae bacterium]|nr:hypothetical protein [Thermoguttaceae bacterium]MDW8080008.1 hypothetical protein [Thermoguttaceae bacterium]
MTASRFRLPLVVLAATVLGGQVLNGVPAQETSGYDGPKTEIINGQSSQHGQPVAEICQLAEKLLSYAPQESDRRLARELIEKTQCDVQPLARLLKTDQTEQQTVVRVLGGLPAEVKFHVFLLSFVTRRPVPRGLTDAALESLVRDGAIQKDCARLFQAPPVQQCLAKLEEISPEKLPEVLGFLARIYWVEENPFSIKLTTWAADSCAAVTRDIVFVEIVNQTVTARLLVQAGILKIPAETVAEFRWSGWPPIKIPLSVKPFTRADRPRLEKLLNSQHAVYSREAKKALDNLFRLTG